MTTVPRGGDGTAVARRAPQRRVRHELQPGPVQPGPAQLLGMLAGFMALLVLCGLMASRL